MIQGGGIIKYYNDYAIIIINGKKEKNMKKKALKRLAVFSVTMSMLMSGMTAFAAETYVTKAGDNLSKIAKELYGDKEKWRDIYELNKDQIKDPNVIFANQALILPDAGTVTEQQTTGQQTTETEQQTTETEQQTTEQQVTEQQTEEQQTTETVQSETDAVNPDKVAYAAPKLMVATEWAMACEYDYDDGEYFLAQAADFSYGGLDEGQTVMVMGEIKLGGDWYYYTTAQEHCNSTGDKLFEEIASSDSTDNADGYTGIANMDVGGISISPDTLIYYFKDSLSPVEN